MKRWLKVCFFMFVVRPLIVVVIGLNVYRRERLPTQGAHVIIANHNSHLDTLVLMSLFPWSQLHRVRPVAAADYFLSNRCLAWFSINVLDIIPIHRDGSAKRKELLGECRAALEAGDIIILFPEGSRGQPEVMQPMKKGVYHLLKESPKTGSTPVLLRGLGRALPKGEILLVPRNCEVAVGETLYADQDIESFMASVDEAFVNLRKQCQSSAWLDEW